jgi:ubiquitin-protein ligase
MFQIRFLTPVYHVNIDQSSGQVCLGFVSADKWNPTTGIEDVLRAVFSLLITPQVETAQNQQILGLFKDSKRIYERRARDSARKFR